MWLGGGQDGETFRLSSPVRDRVRERGSASEKQIHYIDGDEPYTPLANKSLVGLSRLSESNRVFFTV